MEEFAQSRECFAELEEWLSGGQAAALTHVELEEQLGARGRELLRQLHQDHLDLRAAREQRREKVTGADGVARTRAEHGHRRGLVTVFGEVTVTRMAYRAPGAANLHPADAALNLPEEKHSHGLRKLAAIESARGSFESAAQAITRATGAVIGKRQTEELARRAAADINAFYAARRPGPAPDDQLLVLTFDGKGIVMRPEALRPATARAAASARRKLATRLSPGEKHGRKRMAELAAVYDAIPATRTPGDIIRLPKQDGSARRPGPAAADKWLTASVTEDIAAVIAAGFGEAERRDPGHRRTWVALVDGNTIQIDAITAEAKRRHVAVHIVCDFIHVLEYLWKAAWSFFEPGDPSAEDWVAAQAVKILEGKATQVAAGIRRRASTFGYAGAEREGADACAGYLTAKKPWLDYATALARGWPVATGVIEGACRHLVKDRMDITGARWGLDGAEAILKLRSLIASGDFGEYWPFHLRQEHQRVHRSRYDLAA
ncbi:MAG TPA: ISKra4 family transposase [Streptosporangiaceae bacterium]|nr:ISKra4 family transposase [Streptosporangiaceae bacterium]